MMVVLYVLSIIPTICISILYFLFVRDTRIIGYRKIIRVKLSLSALLGYLIVVSFCSLVPFLGFFLAVLCFYANYCSIVDKYYNAEIIFPEWFVKIHKILFKSIW